MNSFSALKITDEDGYIVIEHVSNDSDSTVHVEDYNEYGLPQYEWRKIYHLTDWVTKNKPDWVIDFRKVKYDLIFG